MKTALIVPTCERPSGARYVDRTLLLLHQEGASKCDHRILLKDGPLDITPPKGWSVQAHPRKRGIRAMMWWAFEVASNLDVDQLLFAEDDIEPAKNAIAYILRESPRLTKDVAFVDFYDMLHSRHPLEDGLHKKPITERYWGNQAMLFPRQTIEWLLDHNPFAFLPDSAPSGADHVLGRLLAASKWPTYGFHLPRLVRHVGDVSAAHPDVPRLDHLTVRTATAPDFDALQISI